MSIGFNPQNSSVKKIGREELAETVNLPIRKLKPFFKKAEPGSFKANYNAFVTKYPVESKQISNLRPDGVGPGELLAWFIFDNIELGGKNSCIDLVIDGEGFAEMKGGSYDTKYHALKDFKITKDSDPAVDSLRCDLQEFNDTYRKIVGDDLPGWEPGNILTTTLAAWLTIDLKKYAKQYAGPIRGDVPLTLTANGDVKYEGSKKAITNYHLPTCGPDLVKFRSSKVTVAVNNHTSTLEKIIGRWRQLAHTNYLSGKRFALVNTSSMKMGYFGELTVDMIGLLRIARNQPQARIFLPKETK